MNKVTPNSHMKDIKQIAEEKYPEVNNGYLELKFSENDIVFIRRAAFISGSQYGKEFSFTKEELEAIDRERDRRVAAEAWDAALEYKKKLDYDGNDEFSVPDKEQYINSIINK